MQKEMVFRAAVFAAMVSLAGCGGDGGSGGGGPDFTPDKFTLQDVKDAEPGKFYTASMKVSGVDVRVKARVSGSIEFSVDDGKTFGSKTVDVENGDRIIVRLKSSAKASGSANGSLIVGGTSASLDAEGAVEDTFQVITKADIEKPDLAPLFPLPKSLFPVALPASLTFYVRASDNVGIESVTIGGLPAMKTGTDRWKAQASLAAGPNAIEAVAIDAKGNRSSVQFEVDTTTPSAGSGPSFDQMPQMVHAADTGLIYGVDYVNDRVLAIDPATGNRSELSGTGRGKGPGFLTPRALSVDSLNGRLFVADEAADAVYAVDIATGDRVIVSGGSTGSGPVLVNPLGVAYDARQGRLYVLDRASTDSVYEVALESGERTQIATGLSHPRQMLFHEASRRLIVSNANTGSVLWIDPASGDIDELSGPSVGEGDAFLRTGALALDAEGETLFVVDTAKGQLVRVDVATGNRSDFATGKGPSVNNGFSAGIAWDSTRNLLYVESGDAALFFVAAVSGESEDTVIISK